MNLKELNKERNRRLLKWFNGEKAPPLRLVAFTTAKCNLRCKVCKRTHSYPKTSRDILEFNEMPTDRWLKITKQGLDMDIKEWWIPGAGEPMVRADTVVKIIEEIKNSKKDTNIMMTTNGTLFTPLIIRKFVKLGVDRIQFSIDAPDEKTHDYLRGVKGTFRRAIKSIRLFNYYKKIFGTDKPELYMSSIVTEKSYKKLDKLAARAHTLGCSRINLNQLIVYKEALPKIRRLVIKDYSKLRNNLEKLKSVGSNLENFDVSIRLEANQEKELMVKSGTKSEVCPNTETIEKNKARKKTEKNMSFLSLPCFEPWYNITIDPYGFISPCCNWGKGKEEFSIVGKNLEDVWFGEYMDYFREMIQKGELVGLCKDCSLRPVSDEIRKELSNLLNTSVESL